MAYNSSHTGTQIDDAIDKTQLMPELKGEKSTYANLPGSPTAGDTYLVIAATTGYSAGFYRYSGSAWVFMGSAVITVNTQTGAVVLDADDIDDSSTTHKFTSSGDITKLSNIEDSADVTDTTNVTAAGALMDSEVTNLAEVKAFASSDYATAAQGAKADSALQSESDTLDSVTGRGATTTNGVTVGSIDISGDLDVDGTANLDVVDIDGAVDMASTLTVAGDTVLNSDLEVNVSGASNASKAIVINSSGTNFESDGGMIRILHPSTGSGALTGGFFMKFNANSADKFTVKGNGDTAIAGDVSVTGEVSATSLDINGEIIEKAVNTTGVTGSTALDPANGTIQRLTFSGDVTFTDSLADGESITLSIDDGSGSTATWPTMEWVGGSAPTLDTTNEHIIVVWKVNSTLYGMASGVAS
jgi:cytoskeletal protein CcmA (bactofilin family)